MAWYDAFVNGVNDVTDAVGETFDNTVGEFFESAAGDIRNDDSQVKADLSAADNYRASVSPHVGQSPISSFPWQQAGVIIGAVGVALTLYKLAK